MRLNVTDDEVKIDGEHTTILIQLDSAKPAVGGNVSGRSFISQNMVIARPESAGWLERLRFAAVIFAYIAFGYKRGFVLVKHYRRIGPITAEHIADIGEELE